MKFYILNFITVIFIFCLSTAHLLSQDKRQQNFYNRVYGDDDTDFDVMVADSIWADSPSVVLCEKTHISIHSPALAKKNPVEINGIFRKRILIQEETALEKFTLYYFQKGETVKLKVVKPNGKEIQVPLSSAVEVKREVPSIFRRRYIKSSYFKIAIPNLEVGDILEYYNVFKYYRPTIIYYEGIFNSELPTQKKEITFDLSNMQRTFFDTYNTDVKFSVIRGGGQNRAGKKRQYSDRLRLVLHDLEPKPDVVYLDEFADLPHFKICTYSKVSFYKFLKSKSSDLLNRYDLSNSRILKLIGRASVELVNENIERVVHKMKTKGWENFPEGFYYGSRYAWNSTGIPNFYLHGVGEKKEDIETLFRNGQDVEINAFHFLSVFSRFLETYKYKHDIIVVVPNYTGDPRRIVYPGLAYYGIYIEALDKIYWPHNNHRNHFDIPPELTNGGKGFRFTLYENKGNKLKKIKNPESQEFVLPPISSDEAGQTHFYDLSINTAMDSVIVVDSTIIKGPSKASFYKFLPKYQKFIYNDHVEMYENMTVKIAMKGMNEKYVKNGPDYVRIDKEISKKSNENQLVEFKNHMNGYFDFQDIEIDSFKIVNTGRTSGNPNMVLKSNYAINNVINRAGPNYILNIGYLLGEQIELNLKEEKDRKYDAYFPSALKIENHINVNIPDGYQAKGLENLNANIDNDIVTFRSEASTEGQGLKVYTIMEYNKGIVNKDDWKNVIDAFEAAYDFSQKKLILSKN